MVLLLLAVPAQAARPYDAPDYTTEWGDPPPTVQNPQQYFIWLRGLPAPPLKPAKPALDAALRDGFDLAPEVDLRVAVIGSSRVTGVGLPKFYIWLRAEDAAGTVLAEGAATMAFHVGDEPDHPSVYRFVSAAELRADRSLAEKNFPTDCVIMIEKYLDGDGAPT